MRPLQMIALIRKPAGDKGEFVGLDDGKCRKVLVLARYPRANPC